MRIKSPIPLSEPKVKFSIVVGFYSDNGSSSSGSANGDVGSGIVSGSALGLLFIEGAGLDVARPFLPLRLLARGGFPLGSGGKGRKAKKHA